MLRLKNLLLSTAALFMIALSSAFAGDVIVTTNSGPVVGQVKDSVQIFKGIPYAAAPVGKLRWHAPMPVTSWSTPRQAFKYGPVCVQQKALGAPESLGSEDCLNINVWTPAGTGEHLPVMIFIHGGFYVSGSGDQDILGLIRLTDGLRLAKQGHVVVVSFDYRLGRMGFFANPAIDDGSPESKSGNFGLMDQIAALQWVQNNISAFGGDPSQVTAFGQSAGASSVLTLMASPKAAGLFTRAIVQSGYLKDLPRDRALQLSSKLIENTGCNLPPSGESIADCLRALPPEKVIASFPSSALETKDELFVPNFDGFIIPEPLDEAYASGHVRPISVILGTNSDEATILAGSLYGGKVENEEDLGKTVTESYGSALWQRAEPIYSSSSFGKPQQQLIAFATDGIFTCPISTLGKELSRVPGMHVWRYIFSHRFKVPVVSELGAFHGVEMLYVFGSLPPFLKLDKSENDLVKVVQNYWSGFAKGEKVVDPAFANWPMYNEQNPTAINFTNGPDNSPLVNDYRGDRCKALGL
jgi:para-nitrobenzyl esterase